MSSEKLLQQETPQELELEMECPRCEEYTAMGIKKGDSIWFSYTCPGCGFHWEGR